MTARFFVSCCSYAQPIHRPLETDRDRIVNSALLGRHGHPLCLSFTTVSGFVSGAVQFKLHTDANSASISKGRGIRAGAFMRESNTRTLKPKKLQTATMRRRALKLKSIEVSPMKARSPQVRALVVLAPPPSGM